MTEQLFLVLHWPVVEVIRSPYGDFAWIRYWCACGDRTCQLAWSR